MNPAASDTTRREGDAAMPALGDRDNITLIGMPGVGKSTVGVLLAKATGRRFLDTDLVIQTRVGESLQHILDTRGMVAFCRIEEQVLLDMDVHSSVIATGGSVVYSAAAMGRLNHTGPIVHLDLPLDALERRISDLETRGVVLGPGRTLADLYAERHPLYEAWADLTVDCSGRTQDAIVTEIRRRLAPRDR